MKAFESRIELSPRDRDLPDDVELPDGMTVDVDISVRANSERAQCDSEEIALEIGEWTVDALAAKLRGLGYSTPDVEGGDA